MPLMKFLIRLILYGLVTSPDAKPEGGRDTSLNCHSLANGPGFMTPETCLRSSVSMIGLGRGFVSVNMMLYAS